MPTPAALTLTVLGCGSSIPSAERLPPAYHVATSDGQQWLLDAGAGSTFRLAQAGHREADLDHVFISHTHQDHIAGLLPLLQGLGSAEGAARQRPLQIHGPEAVKDYLDQTIALELISAPPFPIEFNLLHDGDSFSSGALRAHLRSMHHSRPALGLRLELDGVVFVYSADTGPCAAALELAHDADLLLMEASFPAGQDSEYHLTTAQAGDIARRAGVRSLLLTHLFPESLALPADTLETQVRASGYAGVLRVARDLDVIPIGRPDR